MKTFKKRKDWQFANLHVLFVRPFGFFVSNESLKMNFTSKGVTSNFMRNDVRFEISRWSIVFVRIRIGKNRFFADMRGKRMIRREFQRNFLRWKTIRSLRRWNSKWNHSYLFSIAFFKTYNSSLIRILLNFRAVFRYVWDVGSPLPERKMMFSFFLEKKFIRFLTCKEMYPMHDHCLFVFVHVPCPIRHWAEDFGR